MYFHLSTGQPRTSFLRLCVFSPWIYSSMLLFLPLCGKIRPPGRLSPLSVQGLCTSNWTLLQMSARSQFNAGEAQLLPLCPTQSTPSAASLINPHFLIRLWRLKLEKVRSFILFPLRDLVLTQLVYVNLTQLIPLHLQRGRIN